MFKQRLSRFVVMCATACVLAGCVSENPQFTEFKPESKSEKRKNNARIKTELAIQYTQNRDYRAAVQAIDGAIQDDPNFEIAWLIRAQVYQHLKVYDKAEENFGPAPEKTCANDFRKIHKEGVFLFRSQLQCAPTKGCWMVSKKRKK